MQPRRCLLLQLLVCSTFVFCPSTCNADDADGFGLEARCIGGPNEESGSVFSITSVVTVRSPLRCLLENADRPLQCTISVSAPCNDEYTLHITILGKDGGIFRSHEVPMHCGQTLYDASFVVANRHILVNRCDHSRAAFTARKFDILGLIMRAFVQPIFVPNNASPSRPPLIYSRHVPRPYRCTPA